MEINDNNFNEVIKQSQNMLVIVDFWAPWCTPCLMLGPILEKLTEEFKDKIILAKINVDNNPKLSYEYGVNGIPAVKFFKKGEMVDEFVGALPEEEVKKYIEKNLND